MNAIVTGATKGIGRAIARSLAASNYNLALCARNEEELEKFRQELLAEHPHLNILIQKTDCAVADDLRRFADRVQDNFASVEVLVNNAGLFIPAGFFDEGDDAMSAQMQTNVFAAHYLCRVFGKQMRDNGRGHIFTICSIASLDPVAYAASYSVTKVALLGLTKVLRKELMPSGVKVTAILPGSTLTSSWEGTDIPAERFVLAEDVASALLNCLTMSTGANVDEIVIRPGRGNI